MNRSEILRKIRLLHRERRPLNITAIQRSHPRLIAQVYSVKPFWGWAQAIREAGVDYRKIHVDLLDTVDCRICGKPYSNLVAHVWVHKVIPYEYKESYPEDWMISEQFRARISYRMLRNDGVIPHWEPIWTPEYVLDRIHELNQRGIRLDAMFIRESERILSRAEEGFFGHWDFALQKAGVDPKQVRAQAGRIRYSHDDVIAALKKRHKEKRPMNATALMREDVSLANAAEARFGSYSAALLAAEIDPDTVRRQRRPYTENEIEQFLEKVREVSREPLKRRGRAIQALHEKYHNLKSTRFSSWAAVARAAGVPYRSIHSRDPRDFSSREKVVEAIRHLLETGQSVRLHKVRHRDERLYKAVLHYFRDFYDCVLAVGVNRTDLPFRRQRYRSKRDVIAAIQKRDEMGWSVLSKDMHFGPRKKRNSGLVKSGREFFGSWTKALIAAGIPKERRRPNQQPHYPTPESVLIEIRRRHLERLPLSSHVLTKKGSSKNKDIPLVHTGVKFFGSWRRAVEVALG